MKRLIKRIIIAIENKTLFSSIKLRLIPFYYGIKYLVYDPSRRRIKIHCPEYIDPSDDKDESEIVDRIFRSFKLMKEKQKEASSYYRPSSLWQRHLDNDYSFLSDGLKNNDKNKFHLFLSNFGTWKTYHGLESTDLIRNNVKSILKRKYLRNIVFYKQLKTWEWFNSNNKSIKDLSYPVIGNQCGAYIDNQFVGVGSFFNEIYGSILSGLIDDNNSPVIAELGSGYGKLAYFTLRNIKKSCFIDFDLPETLCLAAYYLMKTWPQKKTLLYGEENYSSDSHNKYELIFMPSFEIKKIGKKTVDLFINKNSLGEMTEAAAKNYLAYITDSSNYFFHMNHDNIPNIYEQNKKGLLGYQYPIPEDKFRLMIKYPDIGHMFYQGMIDYNMDIFFYLYERK
jgi:hypothetical protein